MVTVVLVPLLLRFPIHLATAHEVRTELSAFVCYGKRLRDSAQALGLPVEAPA